MMLQSLKSVLVVLVLTAPVHADDGFLDPEDAFRFSARLESTELLEVRYRIAEGYYMYRDRYRFEVEPDSITLGAPEFPSGQWHEDEFFGRSVIYRDEVTIRIPILSGSETSRTMRLVAVSQGCADAGICYLPSTQSMDFEVMGSFFGPDRSR